MEKQTSIQERFERTKLQFDQGALRTKDQRLAALTALEEALNRHEDRLIQALHDDLGKSAYEAVMTEIGIVYGELKTAKKNVGKWMKPKRLGMSLAQLPGKMRLYSDPYGIVLVMSPWNYPALLTLNPLINALSAGNTVILKPSNYSRSTSQALDDLIGDAFPNGEAQVIQGGHAENEKLWDLPFDYIFFTGSTKVGKLVMAKAAEQLIPVTLELGGKSPAIVDESADIEKTAKRLVFGKLVNAGQTCIAPDHVYVHERVKDQLIQEIIKNVNEIFADEDYVDKAWPKMISEKHLDKLKGLLEGQTPLFGGAVDEEKRKITFTILDEPSLDSQVMEEEIFGPILPILTFNSIDEFIRDQRKRAKPLALYLFTKNKEVEEKVLTQLSFGGGCVNDTLLQLSSSKAPFGGVGNSGMGNYHGHYGFKTFSHEKAVLKKWWPFDNPLRHHPYKDPDKKLPKGLFG